MHRTYGLPRRGSFTLPASGATAKSLTAPRRCVTLSPCDSGALKVLVSLFAQNARPVAPQFPGYITACGAFQQTEQNTIQCVNQCHSVNTATFERSGTQLCLRPQQQIGVQVNLWDSAFRQRIKEKRFSRIGPVELFSNNAAIDKALDDDKHRAAALSRCLLPISL
ncbi:hypothetical protein Q8A73_020429 [Channa argus]|nr:hypothetical protein Q8A73_020429 [Channa argus]